MRFHTRGDLMHRIRHKRDLCDPLTIEAWRTTIEPRIKRLDGCMMWTGAHTSRGEPKIDVTDFTKPSGNRRTATLLKRMVALMFVDCSRLATKPNGQDDWEVMHVCGNKSCLNPEHLMVCLDHPKQRDPEEIRRETLKPGTFYEP
jgi:hypothetical protein